MTISKEDRTGREDTPTKRFLISIIPQKNQPELPGIKLTTTKTNQTTAKQTMTSEEVRSMNIREGMINHKGANPLNSKNQSTITNRRSMSHQGELKDSNQDQFSKTTVVQVTEVLMITSRRQ